MHTDRATYDLIMGGFGSVRSFMEKGHENWNGRERNETFGFQYMLNLIQEVCEFFCSEDSCVHDTTHTPARWTPKTGFLKKKGLRSSFRTGCYIVSGGLTMLFDGVVVFDRGCCVASKAVEARLQCRLECGFGMGWVTASKGVKLCK
jgi:hypothetical protein